jgi:prepilin-type N-terminal cleavage/methylation domain-containing protein
MVALGVRRLQALVRRTKRGEGGYSLVELVVTMAILGTVLGGLATLFESGIHSQSDLDARFSAEVQMNTAMIQLRRDAHGACGLKAGNTTSLITLNMPGAPQQPPDTPCDVGIATSETWCTAAVVTTPPSPNRYALWRIDGYTTTCTPTASSRKYADFITTAGVFTSFTPEDLSTGMLARLHVLFPIGIKANGGTSSVYQLDDVVVFRNSGM